MLPDRLLPRTQRRGIRRLRRSTKKLCALFEACGLGILDEFEPDSADHCFLLKKG
jgi:hypothetical protein